MKQIAMARPAAPRPVQVTPLRAASFEFAAAAGYANHDVKIVESREAPRGLGAYDVFVREPGAARGKKIGAILLRRVYA